MQTNASCNWNPPIVNTGEYRAIARPGATTPAKIEWTAQERLWWAELMAKSPERNNHFETEGKAGIGR